MKVGGLTEIGKLTHLESLDATDCAITNAGAGLVGLSIYETILEMPSSGWAMMPSPVFQAAFPEALVPISHMGDLGLRNCQVTRTRSGLSSTNITHMGLEY